MSVYHQVQVNSVLETTYIFICKLKVDFMVIEVLLVSRILEVLSEISNITYYNKMKIKVSN